MSLLSKLAFTKLNSRAETAPTMDTEMDGLPLISHITELNQTRLLFHATNHFPTFIPNHFLYYSYLPCLKCWGMLEITLAIVNTHVT